MPNTNSESAQTIITRIQTLISNHAFETDGDQHIHSTLSFGVAECAALTNTQDWIAGADKDLFRFKAAINH